MDVLAESVGGGAQVVFLLGLGLLCVILLVRSKRYFRQVTQYQVPKPHATAKPSPAKIAAAASRETEKWEASMHDLARDLSGQLDSKIRVLELLIREASEAAVRLETAVKAAGGKGQGTGGKGQRPGADRVTASAEMNRPDELIPPPQPRVRGAARRPPAPRETSQPIVVTGNPRFERVYALADAGMSVAKIASQIGSQVGEVELILSLRGTRS
jgi:hypothetical protein